MKYPVRERITHEGGMRDHTAVIYRVDTLCGFLSCLIDSFADFSRSLFLSVRLSWRRRRPIIPAMLPFKILHLVEHRIPSSSF